MAKQKVIHGCILKRHRTNQPATGSANGHNWSLVIAYSNATEETTWWNNSELALAYLIAQHEATGRAGGF